MKATISKEFAFSASHRLSDLPEGHQCARFHGHNYAVIVELTGEVDPVGFVVDYGELAPFKNLIDGTYDHRHLNDLMGDVNPTAENLASIFAKKAKALMDDLGKAVSIRVGVSETPKTWAWVAVDE